MSDDSYSLCRLCALRKPEMFPIVDTFGFKTEIGDQIRDCLPMVACNSGSISKSVCRSCKENLEKMHDFWKNVQRAGEKFWDPENAGKSRDTNVDDDDADDHRISSLSGDQLHCRHCGITFADSRALRDHERSEINTKWQCQKCPMSFGSPCALRLHKKKPHDKSFVCSDCGKQFLQKTHLAIHVRSHTGEKPFPCDLCDKVYRSKSLRDNHRKTHMGERPFKCSQCDKSFANSARLREHAKFHKDPRPFKCNVCDKGFKRFSARKIHMTIHTGEKAFKCDVCNRAFKRKTDMRKHKKTRHEVNSRPGILTNRR